MSTPSSGRRGRPPGSKSNKKIAAVEKPQIKYASKFVQPILDDLGRSIVNQSAKNQVAKDWVRKLSKSILKKISEGSTTAFAGLQENNDEDIQQKIEQLQKKIESQFSRLKENPHNRTRISIQPTIPEERAYSSGLYEAQFQSIQDKVQRLSDEINSARSVIEERLSTMEKTVTTVQDNVDLYMKYAPLPAAQPSSAPVSAATPSVTSTAAAAAQRSQSAQSAQQTSAPQPTASTNGGNNNNNTTTTNSNNNTNGNGRKRSQVAGSNQHDPLQKMAAYLR